MENMQQMGPGKGERGSLRVVRLVLRDSGEKTSQNHLERVQDPRSVEVHAVGIIRRKTPQCKQRGIEN